MYGIYLQVPFFARTVEIDNHFFIEKIEFFERYVYAVGERAAVVSV